MALTAVDHAQLQRALALAETSFGLTEPNPRVGCVLHDATGRLIAEGATQQAGGPHAEAAALAAARAAGTDTRGGTAWVTLEPCAHHGRTPPCADALVAAGLARVVVAIGDPFDAVAGRGIARLRAAGVQVDVADAQAGAAEAALVDAAHEINIGFFSRIRRGRPWVRMKIAASLDGRTALPDGRSQWITGEAARADGHAWRRRAGTVLTGVGTVLEDDPRLDVRLVPAPQGRQPRRVIVDSRLETPVTARILPAPGEVLMVAAEPAPEREAALVAAGATVIRHPGPGGKVDLAAMLADLAARGVNELHVEAGHKLNGSLWREGLVDELLVYLAPKMLGVGREMAVFGPLADLADAAPLRFIDMTPVGADLRLRLRAPGRERF